MRTYHGSRSSEGCEVTVDGSPLNPRFDLRQHSPTGFEFGYGGSGPAQLALAILADHKSDEFALEHYQGFKFKVIGSIQGDTFTLTTEDIDRALAA
jgi:hypothetical protein